MRFANIWLKSWFLITIMIFYFWYKLKWFLKHPQRNCEYFTNLVQAKQACHCAGKILGAYREFWLLKHGSIFTPTEGPFEIAYTNNKFLSTIIKLSKYFKEKIAYKNIIFVSKNL
jgi:hypothetical protein